MDNSLKNAIRFLLFSYFEIDFDAELNEIIYSAAKVAYKDATLMGAYNVNYSNDKKSNRIKKLINAINDRSIKKQSFKKWHDETCNNLVDEQFTYGNAQKFLNMTIKYLFIIYSILIEYNPKCSFVDFYERKYMKDYSKFQIPVDNNILEAAWNLEKEHGAHKEKMIKFPIKEGYCKTKYGKYNTEKIIPWSSWKKNSYNTFHQSITEFIAVNLKKYKAPLDWEFDAWIDEAKRKKLKENNNHNEKAAL